MSKKSKLRQISKTVWSLDATSPSTPKIVVGAVPGKVRIQMDAFDIEDSSLTEISAENIRERLSEALLQLSERIKKLEIER